MPVTAAAQLATVEPVRAAGTLLDTGKLDLSKVELLHDATLDDFSFDDAVMVNPSYTIAQVMGEVDAEEF